MIDADARAAFRQSPIGRLMLALDDVAEGGTFPDPVVTDFRWTGTENVRALCAFLRDALLEGSVYAKEHPT